MTRRVSASEARGHFSALLDAVHDHHQPVVVEHHGRPVAVLVSPGDIEKLRVAARLDLTHVIDEVHQENGHLDPDEVYQEIQDAVEQVRREAHGGADQAKDRR